MGVHHVDGAGLGGKAGMGLGVGEFRAEIGGESGGGQQQTRAGASEMIFMEVLRGKLLWGAWSVHCRYVLQTPHNS